MCFGFGVKLDAFGDLIDQSLIQLLYFVIDNDRSIVIIVIDSHSHIKLKSYVTVTAHESHE